MLTKLKTKLQEFISDETNQHKKLTVEVIEKEAGKILYDIIREKEWDKPSDDESTIYKDVFEKCYKPEIKAIRKHAAEAGWTKKFDDITPSPPIKVDKSNKKEKSQRPLIIDNSRRR